MTAVFAAPRFLNLPRVCGEAGVARAMELVAAELDRALAIAGITRAPDLTRDHVRVVSSG